MCACAVDGVSFTLTPFATVNFWRGRGVGQVRKREEERVAERGGRNQGRHGWPTKTHSSVSAQRCTLGAMQGQVCVKCMQQEARQMATGCGRQQCIS